MNLKDTAKKKINIIVQLIWPLFFLIISRFCDGQSIAYLAAAAEGYILILLLFLYGMPEAMEKLMRLRIAKGQFKNAGMIFKSGAFITVVFIVITGCVLLGVSKVYTVSVMHMPFGVLTFRILLAFYVVTALILLFRGFFQGTGSYMPTVATGIFTAVFMMVSGILFLFLFRTYGQKAAALLQNAAVSGMYLSAGAALGIVIAGLIPLLLLLVLYFGTGRRSLRQWKKEGLKQTENLTRAGRILLLTAISVSGVYLLNRLPVYLGFLFYQGATKGTKTELLGGYYSVFEMTGLFWALLFSVSMVRMQMVTTGAIKREEMKSARENLSAAMQWGLIVSLFLTALRVGTGTSVINFLFQGIRGQEILFILSGIGTAVFLLATLFLQINLFIGQKRQAYISLLTATAVYIVFVLAGLKLSGNHIYILAFGRLLFGLTSCVMNGFSVSRQINFCPEWIRTILFPILSAAVTGLILFLLKKALYIYLGDALMFFISLIVGFICYVMILMVLKSIRKKELRMMPGGQILEKAGSLLHLL